MGESTSPIQELAEKFVSPPASPGVDFEAGMAKALWLVHQIVKAKLG